MTYYNIVFRLGEEAFLDRARRARVRGLIVPDLPIEEGADFYRAARRAGIDPIQIFAPTSTERADARAGGVRGRLHLLRRPPRRDRGGDGVRPGVRRLPRALPGGDRPAAGGGLRHPQPRGRGPPARARPTSRSSARRRSGSSTSTARRPSGRFSRGCADQGGLSWARRRQARSSSRRSGSSRSASPSPRIFSAEDATEPLVPEKRPGRREDRRPGRRVDRRRDRQGDRREGRRHDRRGPRRPGAVHRSVLREDRPGLRGAVRRGPRPQDPGPGRPGDDLQQRRHQHRHQAEVRPARAAAGDEAPVQRLPRSRRRRGTARRRLEPELLGLRERLLGCRRPGRAGSGRTWKPGSS